MRLSERIALALCALLVVGLSACGGGGSGLPSIAGVGTGGTGMVIGAVTGFGSVVVDGTAYSSATPQYFVSSDQGEAEETSAGSLGLGNHVQLQLDVQGNPASVIIEPALVGAVSRLDQGEFVVNGMAVRINDDSASGPVTYFSGLRGLSGLAVGMQVGVHGAYGIDPSSQKEYVQASLIEQLPVSSTVNRLSGVVTNLNAAAGTFRIGGTTVQMSASTNLVPGGNVLANGLWVNVWSNATPGVNGELRAGVIRVRNLSGTTGPVQIGGIVSGLSGMRFQVSGIPIDGSASALGQVIMSLVPGEYVVVHGQADAHGSALVASAIRSNATQPAEVELNGTITDFVNQGNFLVRGVAVDASRAQLLGATSAANLRNGTFVEVVGVVNGNVITAKSVFAAGKAPTGGTVNYRGTVTQFDAASGSFVLTGSMEEDGASATIRLAPNVAYANGSAAQLVNGARVEVEATKNTGDIVAYGVFFRKIGALTGRLETEGLVYGVTSSTFDVNGLTIQINGVIPQGGALVNGARVEVEFTHSGGRNLAQELTVDH